MYVPVLKGVILLSLICYKWVQCCLLIFPMEALDFTLNYVRVVFGKVSLNYDFFHWCHGSFEFFHIPTLAFGCVAMAGQFEHLSIQVFDKIFLGFCDGDQLRPVRTHPLFICLFFNIDQFITLIEEVN